MYNKMYLSFLLWQTPNEWHRRLHSLHHDEVDPDRKHADHPNGFMDITTPLTSKLYTFLAETGEWNGLYSVGWNIDALLSSSKKMDAIS